MKTIAIAAVLFCLIVPGTAEAQNCKFLCSPELKIEPTFTWENVFKRHRTLETNGTTTTTVRAKRERIFETVVALDVPTSVPRLGFTFETILQPFEKGSSPELELEANFLWLPSEKTKGWVESHFDIVDKYSPGKRPHNLDFYTHKLDFELDTSVAFLKWTKKRWLEDIEIEGSLDYLATGLPRAGDRFGNTLFLDKASPWSFSLVFVFRLAPL
jgi:hypothetical protein